MKTSSFFLLITSLVFLSCGPDTQHSGGGVWDEAGNTMAVQVYDTLGNAVSGALLRVIPWQGWTDSVWRNRSPVTDSLQSNGKKQEVKTPSWPVTLEVEWQGLVAHKILQKAPETVILQLQKPAHIHGTLVTSSAQTVYFAHSAHQVQSDAQGAFTSSVAPGNWTLLTRDDSTLNPVAHAVVQSEQVAVLPQLSNAVADSVIVEDFNQAGNANSWHWLTGAGWWFCGSDASSSVEPASRNEARKPASLVDLGISAHLQFAVSPNGYALCGMDFHTSRLKKSPYNTIDLSPLDSLSFYAQGNRPITVQMIALDPLLPADSVRTYHSQVPLSPQWQRISLTPQDFLRDTDSTLTLENTDLAQINSIIFVATDSTDLWLDHIVLHGVRPDQIYPQLRRPL